MIVFHDAMPHVHHAHVQNSSNHHDTHHHQAHGDGHHHHEHGKYHGEEDRFAQDQEQHSLLNLLLEGHAHDTEQKEESLHFRKNDSKDSFSIAKDLYTKTYFSSGVNGLMRKSHKPIVRYYSTGLAPPYLLNHPHRGPPSFHS